MPEFIPDPPSTSQPPRIEDIAPFQSNDAVDFGDTLEVGGRILQPFKKAADLILYELASEFGRYGPLAGMSVTDLAQSYGQCVHDLMAAARFLSERGVIRMETEPAPEGGCSCLSCQAQRSHLSFHYDYRVDYAIAVKERRQAKAASPQPPDVPSPSACRGAGTVYLAKSGSRYKIGVTTNLGRRLQQLNGQQAAFPVELVHHASGVGYQAVEHELHGKYWYRREHGEWFDLAPDEVAEIIGRLNDWSAKRTTAEGAQ